LEEKIRIFHELLLAVKHAHLENIIHTDLKVSNIFITKDRKVKIGDFKIADIINK
jgi:serine/threonine protein kinase